MKLGLLILVSSLFILGTELLKRKFSLPVAFTRRVIHVGTAIVAGVAPLFATREQIILVSIIFTIVLFFGRIYHLFLAIHSVERHTFGEIFLPLGVVVTAFFFLPHNILAFQFGIFVMGISDGFAGLIGEGFGKNYFKLLNSRKSVEGTCTFFATSLILTFLFVSDFDYRILAIPFILTTTEFFLKYGLDNLVLPILGAYLMHFLI